MVVVAAVIERDDAFLLTLRPAGTHLADHWEFPGGKVHESETHVEALRRELFEELDIVARVGELAHIVTHAYPAKTVELHFFHCAISRGEALALDCEEVRWVMPDELPDYEFPPADRPLIKALQRTADSR